MKRLILSFIISTTLLSAEITKENIGNYIYVSKCDNREYKVVNKSSGRYVIKILPSEQDAYTSFSIDAILSYFKDKHFKISRECGKLEVEEIKKEEK